MKNIYFCLLLFISSLFLQSQTLKLKINSIVFKDSIPEERQFIINYEIENLSSEKVSFFFNPNGITSSETGSMSNKPFYKIFQGEEQINPGTVFNLYRNIVGLGFEENLKNLKGNPEELKKYLKERLNMDLDSMLAEFNKPESEKLKNQNEILMKDLFQLNRRETKLISKVLYWDKKRYYLNGQNEFYLDEKTKHYLELTLILLKSEFKTKLTETQFNAIMSDKNFLNAVIVSNKMEINFSE
ncbi:hypothetical protein MCEGE10_02862 [Flavobacteriaceae bacterium]